MPCEHTALVQKTRASPKSRRLFARKGALDTTPIIAGVLSAGAGVGLIALGVCLTRRRAGKKRRADIQPPPPVSRELEYAPRPEPPAHGGSRTPVAVNGGAHNPPHQQNIGDVEAPPSYKHAMAAFEVDVNDGDRSQPLSTAPGLEQTSLERAMFFGRDTGVVLEGVGAENCATNSSVGMSIAEGTEFGQIDHGQIFAGDESVVDESTPGDLRESGVKSRIGQRRPRGGPGLGQAVKEAAQDLASSCQIPGVSEAVALVSTLAQLVSDSRDMNGACDANLRQCSSIITMLERATKVADKVNWRRPLLPACYFATFLSTCPL